MRKIFSYLTLALAAVSIVACAPKHDKTIANLKSAIDGEATASAKYAAFANQAAKDSLYSVQVLFEATSAAEAIHIKNHQAVLAQLGVTDYIPVVGDFAVMSTAENLQEAVQGEEYESTEMYPAFIADAEAENVQAAIVTFNYAQDSEKNHAAIYNDVASKLATPDMLVSVYYICPKCGNAYAGTASETCELCMTPSGDFLAFTTVIPGVEEVTVQ